MRWNTPLSEGHANLLLDRMELEHGRVLVDLGCGWGELLIRAVLRGRHLTGIGVDIDDAALERGRMAAAAARVSQRVRFERGEAAAWKQPVDRVMCVGSSHAWPGVREAFAGLGRVIAPEGRLVFGDGCWERPPTEEARTLFGADVLAISDLVSAATTAGWRVMHLSTADQREWDDFESTWRAGRERWLLAHPDDGEAAAVRQKLDAQLDEYLSTYRGILGFCYLVLAPRK